MEALHDTLRALHLTVRPTQTTTVLVQPSNRPSQKLESTALENWLGLDTKLTRDDVIFQAAPMHLRLDRVLHMVIETLPLYYLKRLITPYRKVDTSPLGRKPERVNMTTPTTPRFRFAQPGESPRIVTLETQAASIFRDIGMEWVDALGGMSVQEIETAIAADGVYLCQQDSQGVPDEPIDLGFALVWWRDLDCHLREINIHPDYSRHGLGTRLLMHVIDQARTRGCSRSALTTFANVPWNAPWYRRHGFITVQGPQLQGWRARERNQESARGLDRSPRVAMALDLNSADACNVNGITTDF